MVMMGKRSRKKSLGEMDVGRPQEVVATVGMGVTPPAKLINVQQFKNTAKYIQELFKKKYCTEFVAEAETNPDYDCKDLVYVSPINKIINNIENSINSEAWRNLPIVEFIKAAQVLDISKLNELEYSCNLESIKHARRLKEKGQKKLRKMVNYSPPHHPVYSIFNMESKNFGKGPILNEDSHVTAPSGLIDPQNEVIMDIRFFIPGTRTKAQEYLILASQHLDQLKNCVYCSRNNPGFEQTKEGSSFFFIENCFYIDTNENEEGHNAAKIKKWMESNISAYWSLFPVQIKLMKNTKFEKLNFSIGKTYLYCHDGNCEHLMSIKNVRSILDHDDLDRSAYPILIFQNKIKLPNCQVCDRYNSKITTLNDSFALQEPFHYCERCYKLAHLDRDQQPLGLTHKIIK